MKRKWICKNLILKKINTITYQQFHRLVQMYFNLVSITMYIIRYRNAIYVWYENFFTLKWFDTSLYSTLREKREIFWLSSLFNHAILQLLCLFFAGILNSTNYICLVAAKSTAFCISRSSKNNVKNSQRNERIVWMCVKVVTFWHIHLYAYART